jgi:hypothetical protein
MINSFVDFICISGLHCLLFRAFNHLASLLVKGVRDLTGFLKVVELSEEYNELLKRLLYVFDAYFAIIVEVQTHPVFFDNNTYSRISIFDVVD